MYWLARLIAAFSLESLNWFFHQKTSWLKSLIKFKQNYIFSLNFNVNLKITISHFICRDKSHNLLFASVIYITLFSNGYVCAIKRIDFCTRKRRCSHISWKTARTHFTALICHNYDDLNGAWMRYDETICLAATHHTASDQDCDLVCNNFLLAIYWLA